MLQQSLALLINFLYTEFVAQSDIGHIISRESTSPGLRIFWFKPNTARFSNVLYSDYNRKYRLFLANQ
jgi:hypothetical protein